MKQIINTALFLSLIFNSSYGQKAEKIEKPDSVTIESNFNEYHDGKFRLGFNLEKILV